MRRVLLISTLFALVAPGASAFGSANDPAHPVVPNPEAQGCTSVRPPGGPPSPLGQVERDGDPVDVELDDRVIVSPTGFDIADDGLVAGSTFTCMLVVRSRRPATATYEIVPLGVVGTRAGSAAYEFVTSDDERWDQTAGGWLQPKVASIVIPPRGVARIPFRVTIPADPPDGAAYGALGVLSRTRASAGDTSLGVETVVASLLLLRLPGDAAPDLELRGVDAPRLRWNREAWPFSASLVNDGSLHGTAGGRVRVRSIFGNEVASLPIDAQTVLPGGREPIELEWDRVPWLGFYRWDARVATASGEPARSVAIADGWFVALPPWWVLAIAGALLLLLLVSYLRRRAIEWGELADADDDQDLHDDDDEDSDFDFDLAERQLRE